MIIGWLWDIWRVDLERGFTAAAGQVGLDQRLPNPRQNNLQTSAHCLNRGMLLKMLAFCATLGRAKEGWVGGKG